jgi:hypothetical protein
MGICRKPAWPFSRICTLHEFMPLPLVALVDLSYPGKPPQRERAGSGKEGLEHPAHVSVNPDPGDNPVPTMDPSGEDADPCRDPPLLKEPFGPTRVNVYLFFFSRPLLYLNGSI